MKKLLIGIVALMLIGGNANAKPLSLEETIRINDACIKTRIYTSKDIYLVSQEKFLEESITDGYHIKIGKSESEYRTSRMREIMKKYQKVMNQSDLEWWAKHHRFAMRFGKNEPEKKNTASKCHAFYLKGNH